MKWWDVLQETRMGFCVGVAVLAVQVPPNWDAWMRGEIGEIQMGLWMSAAAAVVRGFLWGCGKGADWVLPGRKVKDD